MSESPSFSENLTPTPRGPWIVLLLALFSATAPLSIDLYLPSLPTIAASFHSSAASVQLTLSSFMAGFGGGQLLWGPLGDRFGRRRPIAVGMALFVIASLGCTLAGSVWQIVAWRFVQAIGGCASAVLGTAMVRDLYQGSDAVRIRSHIMLVGSAAPLLAPIIGGQILLILPWQAIFGALTLVGLAGLVGILITAETLPPVLRVTRRPRDMALSYLPFFTDRIFLGYALSSGMIMAGMFAFITGSPFVYISYFGIPARYFGLLFGLNIVGMVLASRFNVVLSRRFPPDRIVRIATLFAAAAGIALLMLAGTKTGALWGTVIPVVAFVAIVGIVLPNGMVGALEPYPKGAGTASALIGSPSNVLGGISGALVSGLADGTPRPMALIICGCGVGAVAASHLLLRRRLPTPLG